MSPWLILIILGIVVAVLVHWALGVALIVLGVVLLVLPATRGLYRFGGRGRGPRA